MGVRYMWLYEFVHIECKLHILLMCVLCFCYSSSFPMCAPGFSFTRPHRSVDSVQNSTNQSTKTFYSLSLFFPSFVISNNIITGFYIIMFCVPVRVTIFSQFISLNVRIAYFFSSLHAAIDFRSQQQN